MAYTFSGYKAETMARATRRSESISFKKSQELAARLRGMRSDKAERYLTQVIAKKQPVKFTKFMDGAGHKRGMAAGKYPIKAASAFLELLKSGVANAENKGLGTPLKIQSVVAQQASRPAKYGRKRGRQAKRTNIELVLVETEESKRAPKKPKGAKPVVPKVVGKIADAPEKAAEKAPAKAAAPSKKEAPAAPAQPKQDSKSRPITGAKEKVVEKKDKVEKSQSPVKKDGN